MNYCVLINKLSSVSLHKMWSVDTVKMALIAAHLNAEVILVVTV